MQNIFDNGYAEPAPPLKEQEECWYLPLFGVYHPHKPDQIRVVFDSSAHHHGVSLNNICLTGPNLNNTLLGVLMQFREERVAVTADIKQMFHSFLVLDDQTNFLHFLWHWHNDMEEPLVENHMRVHVFGNSPSPTMPRPSKGSRRHPKIKRMTDLIRFLRQSVRDKVVITAKQKWGFKWKGCRLSVFPDMKKELAEKRKVFTSVKRKLQDFNVKYTLAYPATLRFKWKGEKTEFHHNNNCG
eukprot:superscaffoldBa00002314_g13882